MFIFLEGFVRTGTQMDLHTSSPTQQHNYCLHRYLHVRTGILGPFVSCYMPEEEGKHSSLLKNKSKLSRELLFFCTLTVTLDAIRVYPNTKPVVKGAKEVRMVPAQRRILTTTSPTSRWHNYSNRHPNQAWIRFPCPPLKLRVEFTWSGSAPYQMETSCCGTSHPSHQIKHLLISLQICAGMPSNSPQIKLR